MPKNRIVETMTCWKFGTKYKIRVWREVDPFSSKSLIGPDQEVVMILSKLGKLPFRDEIIAAIEHLPRVSAIEILDRAGDGLIVYPDWK